MPMKKWNKIMYQSQNKEIKRTIIKKCNFIKPIENNRCGCFICDQLPSHFSYQSRFVIYSLTCKLYKHLQ